MVFINCLNLLKREQVEAVLKKSPRQSERMQLIYVHLPAYC